MPFLTFSNSAVMLLIGLVIVVLIWLAGLTIYIWRARSARKKVGLVIKKDSEILDVIYSLAEKIDGLADKQERLTLAGKRNRNLLGKTIRHTAIVRFDAFPEVGGRLSFAAAFLDEEGNGLVLSSINGRSEGRVYAKPIADRKSEYPLSEEEEAAIREALGGVRV
jgi:hypothetical protein